ncbi:hypothetical protein T439DRAFT_371146 [Meredithblackwellia eburnea MCA 4105]
MATLLASRGSLLSFQPSKAATLPEETLSHIFSYLHDTSASFSDVNIDLFHAALVCRSWRGPAEDVLYRDLHVCWRSSVCRKLPLERFGNSVIRSLSVAIIEWEVERYHPVVGEGNDNEWIEARLRSRKAGEYERQVRQRLSQGGMHTISKKLLLQNMRRLAEKDYCDLEENYDLVHDQTTATLVNLWILLRKLKHFFLISVCSQTLRTLTLESIDESWKRPHRAFGDEANDAPVLKTIKHLELRQVEFWGKYISTFEDDPDPSSDDDDEEPCTKVDPVPQLRRVFSQVRDLRVGPHELEREVNLISLLPALSIKNLGIGYWPTKALLSHLPPSITTLSISMNEPATFPTKSPSQHHVLPMLREALDWKTNHYLPNLKCVMVRLYWSSFKGRRGIRNAMRGEKDFWNRVGKWQSEGRQVGLHLWVGFNRGGQSPAWFEGCWEV